ncbi:hypothetical protein GCM10023094_28910 [Rhodococcus olei]|uniref:Uncharacterized protein n=1 Tax=Rhodococcus olei TaxID=2161675 RepID=A0ABP8P304_9NOCA
MSRRATSAGFAALDTGYGSVDKYPTEGLGLSADTLAKLKSKLVCLTRGAVGHRPQQLAAHRVFSATAKSPGPIRLERPHLAEKSGPRLHDWVMVTEILAPPSDTAGVLVRRTRTLAPESAR